MRIWADVVDASGERYGNGPIIHIRSASITRVLDMIGDFAIEIPGSDGRALDLLQPERRVIIYVEDKGHPREIGQGIIRNLVWNDGEGGRTFTVSGPDILNELARVNLFYGVNYNNLAANSLLNAVFTHVPEWALTITDTTPTTLGFNGASVLAVAREVAKVTGLHFRLEEGRHLHCGVMGDDSGVKIYQAGRGSRFNENPDVALISRLQYRVSSENMANFVSPAGAKQGSSYLGMGTIYGTPQGAYDVKQGINEFGAYYYLADLESIGEYGAIQAVLSFPNVVPASNSLPDQINAAKALYKATATWLDRNSRPQKFYGCTLKNVHTTIRPGQTCFLQYRGEAWRGNERTWPVDIRGDFWAIRVAERFDQSGLTVDVELSDIDQVEPNDDEFIASFMEEVNRLE